MSKFSRILYWAFMSGMLSLSAASLYSLFSPTEKILPDPSELTEITGHLKGADRTNMKLTNDGFWVDFKVEEYPNHRFRWESLDRYGSKDLAKEPPETLITFSVFKNSFPPKSEGEVINVVYIKSLGSDYMNPSKLVSSSRLSYAVTAFFSLVVLVLTWASYRNAI